MLLFQTRYYTFYLFRKNKLFLHENALCQGFPTCGTRTTGGTQTCAKWYAETFFNKIFIIVKYFIKKKTKFSNEKK